MGEALLLGFLPLLLLLPNGQSAAEPITHSSLMTGPNFAELLHHVSNLNSRMSVIEARGKQQENDVSTLKATVNGDKKEIHFLANRVAVLESSAADHTIHDDRQLMKRPARLLPVSVLYGKREKHNSSQEGNSDEGRFYGPPTNCSDMARLGYTLNGYYLIRDSGDQGLIGMVYCQFRHPHSTPENQNLNTLIGNVQIKKNRTVIEFHAERATTVITKTTRFTENIRFKNATVNIGQALNVEHGVFTAPVAGLYHFMFYGLRDSNSTGYLLVRLLHNKLEHKNYASTARTEESPANVPLFVRTYYRMKVGDQVRPYIEGSGGHLYEGNVPCTHFSGWLVEED